jgi:hypothetical protein
MRGWRFGDQRCRWISWSSCTTAHTILLLLLIYIYRGGGGYLKRYQANLAIYLTLQVLRIAVLISTSRDEKLLQDSLRFIKHENL